MASFHEPVIVQPNFLLNEEPEAEGPTKTCNDEDLANLTPEMQCEYITREIDPVSGKKYKEDKCKNDHIQFNELYYCGFYHGFGKY